MKRIPSVNWRVNVDSVCPEIKRRFHFLFHFRNGWTLVAQVVGIQLAQRCHPRLANGTDWHSFLRLPNQPFPNVGPTELLTVGPTNHSPTLAQPTIPQHWPN
ncbi:hypothetical protein AVEN_240080-1 [Araneus ventricosus]|uniref:Uncharacterized protein n=1 Tax=Araneus ventricosus TaxID=182803 RepID=A0A4Y2KPZ7_ARAVE|nr:hypothetical protein AVEN_240080-1 [Araneus ventricosus]